MSLELKKFDMKSIQFKPNENKGPVVVLIGKRDTGKSFLVRDLLYYQQDIPQLVQLYLARKKVTVFTVKWCQNYLFITNIIQLLLKIF